MLRRLSPALFVVIVLAGACAGGSADPPSSAVETSTTAAASEAASDAASGADADSAESSPGSPEGTSAVGTGDSVAQGATPMAASSPIGAFFDGGFEDALADYTVRVEESIVVCMAAQGFEFVVTGQARADQVEQRQRELTIREWTAQYGFGISTSFDSVARSRTSDPNTAIFLGLSGNERELWMQTLSGGEIPGAGGGLSSRPLEEQGCIGQALIETGGQEALEGLSEFGSIYEEGQAAIYDRREMVGAIDAWTRCMSEAGYPGFAGLDDPEDSIAARFDEVIAPLSAALDEISEEEGQALLSGDTFDIERLPDLDVDALRTLQADEVNLALADLDCYEADVQAIYEPLRDEFENGLLQEYAAEFDALKNIGS